MDIETDSGLSIHYEYNDKNYHVIDASVENTGAQTIIHSANYIARSLGIRIKLLTTPLKEGSVVRLFELQLLGQDNQKSKQVLLSAITYFLQRGLFKKQRVTYEDLVNDCDDNTHTLAKLLKEKHISKEIIERISLDGYITSQRNIFYSAVLKEKELANIKVCRGKDFARGSKDEIIVSQADFQKCIEETEPETRSIERAKVYIVSPILIKKKDKWKGLFNGEIISFKMLSREFSDKTQNGEFQFKAGSNIICTLQFSVFYDDEGNEIHKNYEVPFVEKIGEDDNYKMTIEGKKKRIDDSQPSLFDNDPAYNNK